MTNRSKTLTDISLKQLGACLLYSWQCLLDLVVVGLFISLLLLLTVIEECNASRIRIAVTKCLFEKLNSLIFNSKAARQ